jgi:transcriptional regulator with XRE-family HTH domain
MRADIPIGARVRFFREGRAMTQLQLATRTGVSLDYIGAIERGLRTPSQRYLHLIAQALDTSTDALRGQPSPEAGGVGHPGIPAIQDAILGLGDPVEPVDLGTMQERIDMVG